MCFDIPDPILSFQYLENKDQQLALLKMCM